MISLNYLFAVLLVGGLALFGCFWRSRRVQGPLLEHQQIAPDPPYDDQQLRSEIEDLRSATASDFEQIADRMKTQTLAIAEGIERVDRSERRVDATLKRARKKFAAGGYEDPGTEAEVEGLRLLDGDGIGTGGLPTLQPGVDNPGDRPSSVPGITVAQLQRVRGL